MTLPVTAKLPRVANAPREAEPSPAAGRASATGRAPALVGVADQVAEVGHWLERQLEQLAGAPQTLMVSIPAPVVEPETLLESSSRSHGVVWDPPDGLAYAGVGACHLIQLTGSERFAQLTARAADVWRRLVTRAYPDCLPVAPRLYGGLAFEVGAAQSEPWQELGDGCFSLPRIGYSTDGDRATLSLAVNGEEIVTVEQRLFWRTELDALRALLADRRQRGPQAGVKSRVLAVHRPSKQRWSAEIQAIRAGIEAGVFQKIVPARSSRVELEMALETPAVLRRLSRGLKASTRFAFCRQHSQFLGATPERLVSRRGRSITTEALAGSIASGAEGAERLLRSGKDLQEHQLVVDDIVRRLRPHCDRLTVEPRPRVRELRDVLHLLTPISGHLSGEHHVLELVEELHPTPAVGGVPTETAMRWISEHERSSRGWYAAPVGWFDAQGDGDFAVALRSCVLRGREAFLFAGAGIVRDSDPELEYTETELKKQALLTALGA